VNILSIFLILIITSFTSPTDHTQFVNRFIGTGGNGGIVPLAAMPFGILSCQPGNKPSDSRWQYSSKQAAETWQEALLTGNGKHGTMVMGIPDNERIICDHEELFLPHMDPDISPVMELKDILPEVRKLVLNNKSTEAGKLMMKEANRQFVEAGLPPAEHSGPTSHPAFDLFLEQHPEGTVKNYNRQLNLETGEVLVSWQDDEGLFEERVFSSRPDNINVVSLTGKNGKRINMDIGVMETPGRQGEYKGAQLEDLMKSTTNASADELYFHAAYTHGNGGYEGIIQLSTEGGSIEKMNGKLNVRNAEKVLIKVKIIRLKNAARSQKDSISQELKGLPKDYDELFEKHAIAHQKLFKSEELILTSDTLNQINNEDMLEQSHKEGATPLFVERAFAMGRYLFISSCGRYAPPLQGIWGGGWKPEWSGGFVFDSNVNLQVSAGIAGNMHESMMCYFDFIERLLPGWRENADKMLGCRGFLPAHYANPETGYLEHFTEMYAWVYWPGGAGWNFRPFYDYYLATRDKEFLQKRVFPLYREMADFYEDYLTLGKDGKYNIVPSISPENWPKAPFKGHSLLTYNSTYDVAVCKEILTILIEISKELDIEESNIPKWEDMLERLPEYRINEDGALAEWIDPEHPDRYEHRHISHLYPVFPGSEVLPDSLILAARKALDFRARFNTTSAHGLIHLGLMSARLGDSEKVQLTFDRIAQGNYYYNSMATSHERELICYNLDCAMSFPTLVMQSLIISQPGYMELMPTWPTSMPVGKITGLVTQAGVKVDMEWENGQLKSVTFYPIEDTKLNVRYKGKILELVLKKDVKTVHSFD